MVDIKTALKKFVPAKPWEFLRSHRAVILDGIFNFGASICTITYRGFRVFYNRGNALIDRMRREKYYEKKLCGSIVSELKHSKSPLFIDIGANIGLVSLYVLSEVPATKIYAFEPGAVQQKFLKKTIEYNKLKKNISLYSSALGREAGVARFTVHKPTDAAKDGFLDTGRGSRITETEVSVETLDHWWQGEGKPHINVVKIDTEGAELWVLEGGRNFFSSAKPTVYLEIESTNLKVYPYGAHDILKFFNAINYELSTIDGKSCSKENLQKLLEECDTYKAVSRI